MTKHRRTRTRRTRTKTRTKTRRRNQKGGFGESTYTPSISTNQNPIQSAINAASDAAKNVTNSMKRYLGYSGGKRRRRRHSRH